MPTQAQPPSNDPSRDKLGLLSLLPLPLRSRVSSYIVSPSNTEQLWLDLLPDATSVRIARHLSRGTQCSDALNLASVNKTQCYAVWAVLEHPICISHIARPSALRQELLFVLQRQFDVSRHQTEEEAERWADVFKHFPLRLISDAPELRVVKRTLRDLHVIQVESTATTTFLRQMRKSSTIRVLKLFLSPRVDLAYMFETLQTMNLVELSFCGKIGSSDLIVLTKGCGELSQRCPQVRLISLRDLDFDVIPWDEYWVALGYLPACAEMWEKAFDNETVNIALLRGLHSVLAENVGMEFVGKLGSSVTRLSNRWGSAIGYGADDILELSPCTRLKEVVLPLGDSGLEALIEVAPSMPEMERLNLEWPDTRHLNWPNARKGFYKPRGLLLDLVKGFPNLRDLRLEGLVVSSVDWRPMLEYIGVTLRELCIIGDFTTAGKVDKASIAVLLRTILLCNTEIKRLELEQFDRRMLWSGSASDMERVRRAVAEKSELKPLMRSMKRRLTRLDADGFEKCVSYVMFERGRKRHREVIS